MQKTLNNIVGVVALVGVALLNGGCPLAALPLLTTVIPGSVATSIGMTKGTPTHEEMQARAQKAMDEGLYQTELKRCRATTGCDPVKLEAEYKQKGTSTVTTEQPTITAPVATTSPAVVPVGNTTSAPQPVTLAAPNKAKSM